MLGYPISNFETSIEQIIEAANAFIRSGMAFFGYGESNWTLVYTFLRELFLPYFMGGFVLGIATATVTYFIFRPIIYAYKIAKEKKKSREFVRTDTSLKGRP